MSDHAHVAVVKDHNFHRQAALHCCGHFLDIHLDAGVSGDIHHCFIRKGNLGTDGSRKPETHRSQASGCDKMVGPVKLIILGRPHLVLADLGCDNGLSLGQFVKFFDYKLWFDHFFLVIGQRIGAFPLLDLIKPGLSFFIQVSQLDLIDQLIQMLQTDFAISNHRDGDRNVFTDGGGIDVNVHNLGL